MELMKEAQVVADKLEMGDNQPWDEDFKTALICAIEDYGALVKEAYSVNDRDLGPATDAIFKYFNDGLTYTLVTRARCQDAALSALFAIRDRHK